MQKQLPKQFAMLDKGDLLAALDVEPSSSTRGLAEESGVGQKTVWNHLKQLDFIHPQKATTRSIRIEICRQLLNNPLDNRFWKQIVTSDEKWVYLINHDQSKR